MICLISVTAPTIISFHNRPTDQSVKDYEQSQDKPQTFLTGNC